MESQNDLLQRKKAEKKLKKKFQKASSERDQLFAKLKEMNPNFEIEYEDIKKKRKKKSAEWYECVKMENK